MATAVQFEQTGARDVLTPKAVSQAAPGPNEVWLEQEAIGVNFLDVTQRRGAVGFDGQRLHFRAWNFRHGQWRDDLPVRVSDASTFATEPLAEPLPRVEEWETIVCISLQPRSDLSADQKQAAREEYGFDGKELIAVQTRAALAFYFDR